MATSDAEVTKDARNTFAIGNAKINDPLDNLILDAKNGCLFDHFDLFNSTEHNNNSFCYLHIYEKKSYDESLAACYHFEQYALTHLNRKTHFRLAQGKDSSEPE